MIKLVVQIQGLGNVSIGLYVIPMIFLRNLREKDKFSIPQELKKELARVGFILVVPNTTVLGLGIGLETPFNFPSCL
jgi:hypothetical protein